MAVPWLLTLPKAARIFYPIALGGVAKGLSANTILQAYSSAGPGIRRTLGLEVVRGVRNIKRKARAAAGLHLDLHPNIEKIPFAYTDIRRKFSYLVEFQGVTEKGKSVISGVTVVSDTIITRREAEAMAATFLDEMPASYGIESVEKIQLVGITKSAFKT